MADTRKLTLRCPECESRLVVDSATGEVLSHQRPKQPPAGGRNLEDLLRGLETEKSQAEEVFEREVAAMKDRERLMEEKFTEALKRAKESPEDEPPPRPFDFD